MARVHGRFRIGNTGRAYVSKPNLQGAQSNDFWVHGAPRTSVHHDIMFATHRPQLAGVKVSGCLPRLCTIMSPLIPVLSPTVTTCTQVRVVCAKATHESKGTGNIAS